MISVVRVRAVLLVLALVAGGCGRRNFNPDASADTASLPCSDPPPGCVSPQVYECNGRCYASCANLISRPAAAAMCNEWGGGCLAKIDNPNDNNCAAARASSQAWIGVLQAQNQTSPAEAWTWCDGTPLAYTAWNTAQPDDNGNGEDGEESCASINTGGFWSDLPCAAALSLVCNRSL